MTLSVFPDPPLQQLLSKAKPVTVLSLCHPREAATHGPPLTAQHCPAGGDGSPPRLCQRNLVGSSSVHRQHGNLFLPPSLSLWRRERKQRGWFCSVKTQRSQQEKCPNSVRQGGACCQGRFWGSLFSSTSLTFLFAFVNNRRPSSSCSINTTDLLLLPMFVFKRQ